jgi:transposase InsO family protein
VAAAIKEETLCAIERDRVNACQRITITEPGVVRGFDQKWLETTEGLKPALVCADSAIPYRTHIVLADAYDEASVIATLEADFEANGPPLVLRLDRASVHRTPRVDRLLRRYRVLRLHGPPRTPRYYGQLERQNREHEAWVSAGRVLAPRELAADLTRMRDALNDRWPRRTLQWRTAADVWRTRAPLAVDRDALAQEVDERAARILTTLRSNALDADVARRFAIEHSLESRGLLRRRGGIEC